MCAPHSHRAVLLRPPVSILHRLRPALGPVWSTHPEAATRLPNANSCSLKHQLGTCELLKAERSKVSGGSFPSKVWGHAVNTLVNALEEASSSMFPSSRARLSHWLVFPVLDACSVPAPGTEAHRQTCDTVHPEMLPAE